ncbi:MAG: catalase [Balneolaceae bacterium]
MQDHEKDKSKAKQEQLDKEKKSDQDKFLTTNNGVRINDNQNSLKAGERGPTLLEDFVMREKIQHFDHERIPERVVHARGSGAHGYFESYGTAGKYTKAHFLQKEGQKTPVFVRFSTVVGSRGSTDLARDVRGFATKFYTEEGNYDLVANNIPVFFIQDSMKFPDLVHAIKPEPDSETPQASAAHDTFWDFISLMPESMHMIMWVMSDRAIPRSFRMMEGFGVHTFRMLNEKNESTFVKLHWKPLLGVHGITWDEAQKISGKDPDFLRKDLWDAIDEENYPEFELGIQVVEEKDEHSFDFDLLDPTKLIPEEEVPVEVIGKMTLNKNPDNFFAETEQVAFHPGHVVPGIDFTNDPLLQGRLFSYTDTQLIRLGGPNFPEIPINRPVAPVHNNQRDGFMRQTINQGQSSYDPNTTGSGCPFQAKMSEGGFTSHNERIEAHKIRGRSKSFTDHFSQATLFYNSQSETEKEHIASALCFELGKVKDEKIRERMVGFLNQVDMSLATEVADGLGLKVPSEPEKPLNRSVPADADQEQYEPIKKTQSTKMDPALSMIKMNKRYPVKGRKVAILAADGVDDGAISKMKLALKEKNVMANIIAPKSGSITSASGESIKVDKSFLTTSSVLFDAVYIPGGSKSIKMLSNQADAIHFINEAFKHFKPIAANEEAVDFFNQTTAGNHFESSDEKEAAEQGVILNGTPDEFIDAISRHRFWHRKSPEMIPA